MAKIEAYIEKRRKQMARIAAKKKTKSLYEENDMNQQIKKYKQKRKEIFPPLKRLFTKNPKSRYE